jgi:hypothetical protein
VTLGLNSALIYAAVQMRAVGYVVLMIALWFLTQMAVTTGENSLAEAAIHTVTVGLAVTVGPTCRSPLPVSSSAGLSAWG